MKKGAGKMKAKIAAIVLGICCICCACGSKTKNLTPQNTKKEDSKTSEVLKNTEVTEKEDLVSVEDSLWHFSYALFDQNIEQKNPVLSPVSAYLALGMVELGAKEDTLTEFELVLGKDAQELSKNLLEIMPTWLQDTKGDNALELANSAWLDTALEAEQNWLNDVGSLYMAEIFQTELSSNAARKDINDWIEKHTHSLIKNFLTKNLEATEQMVLCNTVYFKGKWNHKFDKQQTRERTFSLEDGTTKEVEMMQGKEWNLPYFQSEDAQGVILKYRDGSMGLVALKPENGKTVREMYENLTKQKLETLLDDAKETLVNIRLPKFEIEMDVKLNESLKQMGLQKVFDKNMANLTGIGVSQTGYLFVGSVRQKAIVKLDEEGTEAAAVTAVVIESTAEISDAKKPIDVYFDEPFLYMIMDLESKTPVFIGIVDEP